VFNATFNNILTLSWRSVLLVEETRVPEKTTDLSQFTDKLYHTMLYTLPWSRFELYVYVYVFQRQNLFHVSFCINRPWYANRKCFRTVYVWILLCNSSAKDKFISTGYI
jgi:hypothetical protein